MFLSRFLLAAFMVLLSATGAHAACGLFPTSKYLGTYTHAQIKDYVATQQNGDWSPYLSLLQENLQRLRDINLSGEGAVLRVKGAPAQLNANQLTRFIYVSQQWLDVAKCLSAEVAAPQTALSIDDLSNFATAAGGDMPATRNSADNNAVVDELKTEEPAALIHRSDDRLITYLAEQDKQQDTQVTNVTSMELSVRIEAVCNSGYTAFKVVNNGATWPNVGTFSMFRLDGENKQLISARRLTMNSNEKKTFSIAPTQNRTGRVGISIEPSWYERPFTMDAAASCER